MQRTCSLVVTLALLGAGACATTTRITTASPGASVVREGDGKVVGTTPVEVQSSMWLWESERYLVKLGGKSKSVELKRSEVDLLPMAGGVCLSLTGCGLVVGVPLILAGGMKLPAETKVVLEKGEQVSHSGGAGPQRAQRH